MVELIVAKREGRELHPDALRWIISEYTADRIPDYQLSAFLMAVIFKGMNQDELAPWTEAMLHSGDVLDLSDITKPRIDKHSTGGVGDKISIPLAPIAAACGLAVPMMSGRGLGHTGGTLDKLESIPGFSTELDPEAIALQLQDIGLVMTGQSERLAPADRRIYALRDSSGTVPSISLISSSIMSKKLAEDLEGLLLDVKVGRGAFMKTVEQAHKLASTMVGIGKSHDTPVTALLTNMDQPLGVAVGNANEIAESVAVLRGEGPHDVVHLVKLFATEMLLLAGGTDIPSAQAAVDKAIASGAGYDMFLRLVERQGGDPAAIEDLSLLPSAPFTHEITADRDGWMECCDAYEIGAAAVRLGAGRARKDDLIDPGVGFEIMVDVGDEIATGQTLARVTYRSEDHLESALSILTDAFEISDEAVARPALILGAIR
jgi:pyrimidine-nucleoside phosphorylase